MIKPDAHQILVVDNEEALRTVLSAQLRHEGFHVTAAEDGAEALRLMGLQRFDLVILDIGMPEMDGFEVLKFIKKNYQRMKVIMLTGFSDLRNAVESKKLGADDFLSKPYDIVDLMTNVERVLAS